jgi:hypothetical protein
MPSLAPQYRVEAVYIKLQPGIASLRAEGEEIISQAGEYSDGVFGGAAKS